METLLLVLGVALPTFLTRYVGLAMSAAQIPARGQQALRYVPIAVFAALVTTGLNFGGANGAAQAAAMAAAALVASGRHPFWLSMLAGMLVYGLVRWATL